MLPFWVRVIPLFVIAISGLIGCVAALRPKPSVHKRLQMAIEQERKLELQILDTTEYLEALKNKRFGLRSDIKYFKDDVIKELPKDRYT